MNKLLLVMIAVVAMVVLVASEAMAASSSDPLAMLVTLLPFILPAIGTWLIGWLIKSPLGKKLPKPVADFLTDLTPEEIDEYVTLAGTSQGRREFAIDKISRVLGDIATRNHLDVSEEQLDKWAGSVLDHLIIYYKAGVRFATSKVRR